MTADDSRAGEFRGASFMSEDFTGATFRDCDLRQVKITDSWLVDVSLSGLTDDDLERGCPRLPAPGYPDQAYTVGRCLNVIMKEECEHRRYAVRDLAVLEAGQDDPPAHYDTAR